MSLCVGLLIDDAIVVRENIVRHVQMGKKRARRGAGRHAGDRPGGAGHHLVDRRGVPAHRLHGRHHRQVLPRVRHHHRQRGADQHVRQLHARPDAVQRVARPAIHAEGAPNPRKSLYDRTLGRADRRGGCLLAPAERLLHAHPRLVAAPQAGHAGAGAGHLRRQLRACCRWSAPNSCPRPTSPRPSSTSTPRWARRSRSPAKTQQVERIIRERRRCSTRWPPSTPARCWAATRCRSSCAWSTASSDG